MENIKKEIDLNLEIRKKVSEMVLDLKEKKTITEYPLDLLKVRVSTLEPFNDYDVKLWLIMLFDREKILNVDEVNHLVDAMEECETFEYSEELEEKLANLDELVSHELEQENAHELLDKRLAEVKDIYEFYLLEIVLFDHDLVLISDDEELDEEAEIE
ncbi:MAG: hypothetical protein ACOX28_01150 [Bacilli bacterium]|jgi:hypothetical protein